MSHANKDPVSQLTARPRRSGIRRLQNLAGKVVNKIITLETPKQTTAVRTYFQLCMRTQLTLTDSVSAVYLSLSSLFLQI
jgi:hypothetical protein